MALLQTAALFCPIFLTEGFYGFNEAGPGDCYMEGKKKDRTIDFWVAGPTLY
jgi:hypothetical protein